MYRHLDLSEIKELNLNIYKEVVKYAQEKNKSLNELVESGEIVEAQRQIIYYVNKKPRQMKLTTFIATALALGIEPSELLKKVYPCKKSEK